jgi:hypothetical protein
VPALVILLVGAGAAPALAKAGPTLRASPTVTGAAVQGAHLYASPGKWSGQGEVELAYRWYRCDTMGRRCTLLRGATRKSRTLGGGDVGHTLSLAVRATDTSGSTTAYANLVGPIGGAPPALVARVQPSVSGAAVQGGTVRVSPGTWTPTPSSFSFQWARCSGSGRGCAPIKGATEDRYSIQAKDLGHALVAIVQARAGATTQAVFSRATPVAVAPAATADVGEGPVMSVSPLVAQVVQEGNRLFGATGSWSGAGAIRYAYRWYRCDASGAHCTTIAGATGSSYTQVAKDVGKTVGFAVRATDEKGTTTAYASLVGPVAPAGAALVSTAQPTIAGAATAGQMLQVSTGSWSQAPSSFAFQWQRCNANGRLCTPIEGATASTYTVIPDDSGHRLVALVRAAVGTTMQETLSLATPLVPAVTPPGPAVTAAPTVSGVAQQGQQLAGTDGTWAAPSGAVAFNYNWYRCDAFGAHCKSVSGATKPTYRLGARDAGQTLGFAVHATDSQGTTTGYAALVGPIAPTTAAIASTVQPLITGDPRPGLTVQVSNGEWSQAPTSFSYQWQRCNTNGRRCTTIAGATAAAYTVTPADAGFALVAVVQAVAGTTTQPVLSTRALVTP